MRFTKVSTQTLRQQVYDQLREKIISAGVLPVETLSLRGLAEEFGVSLMPVREALCQLESERVVVIETNRCIRVNALSVAEIQDLYQVRLFLEPLAAERSCARRPDSALPTAKALLEQTARYLKQSPRKYIQANYAFHRTIYRYCGSEIFLRLIDLLWARVGPYFYFAQLQEDVDLSGSQHHHEEMYEAWAARDATRMITAVRNDLASPILPALSSGANPPFTASAAVKARGRAGMRPAPAPRGGGRRAGRTRKER
jgi:DNA-binding GntR family transcriptional regulator